MKYCTHCEKEFDDEVNFCPVCGSAVSEKEQPPKNCPTCGKELDDGTNFCPSCGTHITKNNIIQDDSNNSISIKNSNFLTSPPASAIRFILAFMIISCIINFGLIMKFLTFEQYAAMISIGFLPLFWKIPMTVHFYTSSQELKKVSTTFKICTLFFVSGISGIIMLCNKDL